MACQHAGIGRRTYFRWRKRDPDFRAKSQALRYPETYKGEMEYQDAVVKNLQTRLAATKRIVKAARVTLRHQGLLVTDTEFRELVNAFKDHDDVWGES